MRIGSSQIEFLRGRDCADFVQQCTLQMAKKLANSKKIELAKDHKEIVEGEEVLRPMRWSKAPRLFRYYEEELYELACANSNANFTFQERDLKSVL